MRRYTKRRRPRARGRKGRRTSSRRTGRRIKIGYRL